MGYCLVLAGLMRNSDKCCQTKLEASWVSRRFCCPPMVPPTFLVQGAVGPSVVITRSLNGASRDTTIGTAEEISRPRGSVVGSVLPTSGVSSVSGRLGDPAPPGAERTMKEKRLVPQCEVRGLGSSQARVPVNMSPATTHPA